MAEFIHGEQNEIGLSIYDYNGIKRTAIYNENKINEPVILKNLEA